MTAWRAAVLGLALGCGGERADPSSMPPDAAAEHLDAASGSSPIDASQDLAVAPDVGPPEAGADAPSDTPPEAWAGCPAEPHVLVGLPCAASLEGTRCDEPCPRPCQICTTIWCELGVWWHAHLFPNPMMCRDASGP